MAGNGHIRDQNETDRREVLVECRNVIAEIEERLALRWGSNRAVRFIEFDAPMREADRIGDAGRFAKPCRVGVVVGQHDRRSNAPGFALAAQLGNKLRDERLRVRWIEPRSTVPLMFKPVVLLGEKLRRSHDCLRFLMRRRIEIDCAENFARQLDVLDRCEPLVFARADGAAHIVEAA